MAFPIFELKSSGKPVAIIKTGDRQLDIIKIKKIYSKYFVTKSNLWFELDDEYEYKYKKTGIYFYNFSNTKPLSLYGMNEIDTRLRNLGDSELINKQKLIEYFENIRGVKPDLSKIQEGIVESLSEKSTRFLQDYSNDDEFSKTNVLVDVHNKKKPIIGASQQLMGIGFNRGAIAIIQIAHKQIDIVPMLIHENNGYTKYGTFTITRDNVYMYKKQPVCVFILNDSDSEVAKPFSKHYEKIMNKMMKGKLWYSLEVFNRSDKSTSIGQTREPANNISLSSEKPLVQYNADSPHIFTTTVKEIWSSKEAVATKLSDNIKKVIPIVLIFACIAGFALFISNLPMIIDTIAKYTNAQKVIILTEEEARKRGLIKDPINKTSTSPPPNPIVVEDRPQAKEQQIVQEVRPTPQEVKPAVQDLKPILINLPDDMVVEANNPRGKIVTYVVNGTGQNGQPLMPQCDPASGSIFPVGDNTVVCSLTDNGVTLKRTFMIKVEGKGEASIMPAVNDTLGLLPPLPAK